MQYLVKNMSLEWAVLKTNWLKIGVVRQPSNEIDFYNNITSGKKKKRERERERVTVLVVDLGHVCEDDARLN